MNPDQTVPKGSGSILFAIYAGKGIIFEQQIKMGRMHRYDKL